MKQVTVALVLGLFAFMAQAQEASKKPSAEEMKQMMESSMGAMAPMMGKMAEATIEAQLSAAEKPETARRIIGASPTTGSVEGIVTEPPASEKKAKTTGRLAISAMTLSAKLRFRTRRVLASDQPLRVTRPPRAGSEKLSCPVST